MTSLKFYNNVGSRAAGKRRTRPLPSASAAAREAGKFPKQGGTAATVSSRTRTGRIDFGNHRKFGTLWVV